jgi:hypothetical protein
MTPFRSFLVVCVLAVIAAAWTYAQSDDKLPVLQVQFDNTTTKPVDIYCLDADGSEDLYAQQLPSSQSVKLSAYEGTRWRIKIDTLVLAEYRTGAGAKQLVNVAELITWQLPVLLVVANDTDDAVDIFVLHEKGNEVQRVQGLDSGKQYVQDGAVPGSECGVRRDGKLVAEFILTNQPKQEIPLKALIADYSTSVTITFANTTDQPVSISWRFPDGQETLYIPNLEAGAKIDQVSRPGNVWVIRQNNQIIASVIAGTDGKQLCDVKVMAAALKDEIVARLKATPPKPDGGDKPPKPE